MIVPEWKRKFGVSFRFYLISNVLALIILLAYQITFIIFVVIFFTIQFQLVCLATMIGLFAAFLFCLYWTIKGAISMRNFMKNHEKFKDYYFKVLDPKVFDRSKFIGELRRIDTRIEVDNGESDYFGEETVLKLKKDNYNVYLIKVKDMGTTNIYCHVGPIVNEKDKRFLDRLDQVLIDYVRMQRDK